MTVIVFMTALEACMSITQWKGDFIYAFKLLQSLTGLKPAFVEYSIFLYGYPRDFGGIT